MRYEKKNKFQENAFFLIAEKLRSSSPEDVMSGFELAFCALQQGCLSLQSQLLISLFSQLVGVDWTHTLDTEGLELASDYYTTHLVNTAESLEGIAHMLREASSAKNSHAKISAQLEAEVLVWPRLSSYAFLSRNLEVAARYYRPTKPYLYDYRNLLNQLADEVEHSETV